MGITSAILGGIGGLTTILGILTALNVVAPFSEPLSWTFWFSLSALLLLASIAFALGRGAGGFD